MRFDYTVLQRAETEEAKGGIKLVCATERTVSGTTPVLQLPLAGSPNDLRELVTHAAARDAEAHVGSKFVLVPGLLYEAQPQDVLTHGLGVIPLHELKMALMDATADGNSHQRDFRLTLEELTQATGKRVAASSAMSWIWRRVMSR